VPLFRLDALKKEAITVGREPQNDLVIVDQRVSRYHAQILHQGEHWVVHDLDSTSGTFVSYSGDPGQEKPVKGMDFALKNGSIVRFGPASYTLLQYGG
jgi:pSer/pThr/pTyr-binding forkhead associated (FHA) protein